MSSLKNDEDRPEYWRSLEELDNSPEFRELLANEFAAPPEEPTEGGRRRFLQVMGASFALATGASGCRWPEEKVLPHTRRPDGAIPGKPLHYATAMDLSGVGRGLLVRSYDGRPIKIEGNPEHPDSGGACDSIAQASILELYDPDRSQGAARFGGSKRQKSSFEEFDKYLAGKLAAMAGGAGLRILSGASSSPSLADMRKRMTEKLPQAQWVEWEAISDDNELEGSKLAFGAPHRTLLDLSQAKVVVTLDADLLGSHPNKLKHTRDFAARRDPAAGEMSRVYAFENTVTITGASADHRQPIRSELIKALAAALDAELSAKGASATGSAQAKPAAAFLNDAGFKKMFDAAVADLLANKGASVVAAGANQPKEVHALVHRINTALGNVGTTVKYAPIPDRPAHHAALANLTKEMNSGAVKLLIMIGTNPVYDAPGDVPFKAALAKVTDSVHFSLFEDETSKASAWHVPLAHFLESWGDVRSWSGTVSITQPLIAPLYGGRSAIEIVAQLIGDEKKSGLEIVQRTHQDTLAGEALWKKAVHDGVVTGTRWTGVTPALKAIEPVTLSPRELGGLAMAGDPELVFAQDPGLYDGRFANNGWLMEMPDPLTKLTWDNALMMSPATAKKLGVTDRTLVKLTLNGKAINIPVLLLPGHGAGSMTVHLGYGRTDAGHVAGLTSADVAPVGSNAHTLRSAQALGFAGGAKVAAISEGYKLAMVQDKHSIDSVGKSGEQARLDLLVREGTLDEWKKHPDFARHRVHHPPLLSLWKSPVSYDGYKWGMTIDLAKCTGCNACITACIAENNIPVAGKSRVLMGRELHWISVHRYYKGDPENPEFKMQPVTCQQCENAPCEQVCPVGATMHSSEGLNDMSYNRCIGTRYCSNNCPYKVRRFNYFNYHMDLKKPENKVKKMVFNPEVTVRFRGVMEKCTFCIQRIQNVKIEAKNARRRVKDGEIVTACQQTCPADAISFGDLNDGTAQVKHNYYNPRAYALLQELNTRPRLHYLAKVTNPHPTLKKAEPADSHGGGHGTPKSHDGPKDHGATKQGGDHG